MQSSRDTLRGAIKTKDARTSAVIATARRLLAVLVLAAVAPAPALAEGPTVAVYKTPTCGCCNGWIDHLRAAGFEVEATDLESLTRVKASNGVPRPLASCHTALVAGYVIEGHVPAEDIRRLLEERPAVSGLAVPGMPLGSPGMEHPDATRHEDYEVLSFGPDGVAVFAQHEAGAGSPHVTESR